MNLCEYMNESVGARVELYLATQHGLRVCHGERDHLPDGVPRQSVAVLPVALVAVKVSVQNIRKSSVCLSMASS